ncbi:MAG: TIGR03087 family PEP-CTERM/XrtA system glycosyltransferase [Acetobacteraceae bacterium]|nr:TIGR03087 family PEP-CTERM/XrtA system glycosyltransferase [Acetobacteraceae bacterium]
MRLEVRAQLGAATIRDLLFLAQRIPYPPTKGEKIRAWPILQHLAASFRVHLGCLVDDPEDEPHIGTVAALCATSHFARLDRRWAKLKSLTGLLTGEPLSVTFYRDRALTAWVARTLREIEPAAVFVFSSNMAPYVLGRTGEAVTLCDLTDVDSEKWRAYAEQGGAMQLVHRREWRRVAALEGRIARDMDWSTFVSEGEADLFRAQWPAQAGKVRVVPNGVNFAYFDPAISQNAPYPTDQLNFVFTGTMDYPPNVDAVRWFAADILPIIRGHQPARFHIVGANPAAEVRALAGDGVFVTGRVPDVRPYVAHATAAVAPMRIARGIQNKVLEAMAMARPVVVTPDALEGIDATPGTDVLLGADADAFAAHCLEAAGPGAAAIGASARRLIERSYSWAGRLQGFDALLDGTAAPR